MSSTSSFLKQQISSYHKSPGRGMALTLNRCFRALFPSPASPTVPASVSHWSCWRPGCTPKAWRDLSLSSFHITPCSAWVPQEGASFIILTFDLEMEGPLPCHHHCLYPAQTPFTPQNRDALEKGHCGDRFVKTKGQVYVDLQVSEAY